MESLSGETKHAIREEGDLRKNLREVRIGEGIETSGNLVEKGEGALDVKKVTTP